MYMKRINGLMVFAAFLLASGTMAQRKVADLTLVYDITVESKGDKPEMAQMFNGATTTVYIKDNNHRTEDITALGQSATIYNGKTGGAVVLKEYGNQKLLIRMTAADWKNSNNQYDGIKFETAAETKTIAGYKCIKAVGTMKDGSSFFVYYTKDIIPENKEYNAQFAALDGLVMEYSFTRNKMTVVRTVSQIRETIIPPSKFEIPQSGYREMTYAESRKGGGR
jgi:GLPGLI family protein